MDFSKLFTIEQSQQRIIYKVFRFKISFVLMKKVKKAIQYQNNYNLTALKSSRKTIVFLIPSENTANGGIMSIFSLCKMSREICKDANIVISTVPGKITYAQNNNFKNDEKIYRWSQIIENSKNVKEMIIHVPEYYADKFYKNMRIKDKCFLKTIKNLQINILNQNLDFMPSPEKIQNLYKLTDKITQTTAHKKYATQEVCNKWNIPTHWFSVFIDYKSYKNVSFENKERLIVISPDKNEYKENVLDLLQSKLEEYEIKTVQNMTFEEYMDLIAKAFVVITFGEGFDGYFTQPPRVKTVSFAVFNKTFFPDESWLELKNVYKSYEDMLSNIVEDIKSLEKSSETYYNICKILTDKRDKINGLDKFKGNLKRFYEKQYDFLPEKEKEL